MGCPCSWNDNTHVMYVWIDALCNYLTAIGYPDINNQKFKKILASNIILLEKIYLGFMPFIGQLF